MKNYLQSKTRRLPLLIAAITALGLLSSCVSQMGCPGSIVNGIRRHGHYTSINKHGALQPLTLDIKAQQPDENANKTKKITPANVSAFNSPMNNTINF